MKKYCFLFLFALALCATPKVQAFEIHVSLCDTNCAGSGWSCIHIEVNLSNKNVTNAKVTATKNTITFDVVNFPAKMGSSYTFGKSVKIGNDLKLPADLPKQLGYGSIKVLPGTYTVNYQGNKLGSITMNTVTTPLKGGSGTSGQPNK